MDKDRALSLGELLSKDLKEDVSQQIIGNGVLNKGSILMVVGPPKSYKSFILNTMAMELAIGQPLFGTSVAAKHGGREYKMLIRQPQRVLIFEQEVGEYDLYMRLKPLVDSLPPEHKSLVNENIFLVSQDHSIMLDRQSGMDEIRRHIDQVKPTILAFDPFRNFHILKEIDESDMNRVMRNLQWLRIQYGLSQVVLHHTPKASMIPRSGPDNVRGSSVIAAAVDSIIEVARDSTKYPRVSLSYTIRRGIPISVHYIQLDPTSLRMCFMGWDSDPKMRKQRKLESVIDISDMEPSGGGTIQ